MNYLRLACGFLAVCICANFGIQKTSITPEMPPIDFFGTLLLRNGEQIPAKYITISSLYEHIPLYGATATPEQNPLDNITRFNLKQIASLTIHHEQATIRHKHRTFIPITITLRNSEKATWSGLIETTRKIVCHQVMPGNIELSKEISIDALASMNIQGYRPSKNSEPVVYEAAPTKEIETQPIETQAQVHYTN